MGKKQLRVNTARLEQSIHALAMFGRNEHGGLDRTTFTPAELAARDWLKDQLARIALEIRVDQAANIWAVRKGNEPILPAIAFGSHIDTVPNGGKYDGALGVLIALEVMRVLQEHEIITRHPLELVSFSAEEPNPFGLSTFGSRAVTKKLKRTDIMDVKNPAGQLLTDALRSAGGDPDRFEDAARGPEELSAFLEVHIEQGKRLLERNIPVGVVTAITGIYRETVMVSGEANHAGTTLMEDRKDALTASCGIVLSLEKVCRNHPASEVVGTVGRMVITPNAANIIPEKAWFIAEIRGKSRKEIQEVITAWESCISVIEKERGAIVQRTVMLDQPPAPMDDEVIRVSQEQAHLLGYPFQLLGSMAGHDAAHMASITRSGMLFVPSIDGKSHCPDEESRMEDIEKAANVLLHTILELDQRLDR
ncbi:Zn-dependent hydrolase [Paenibacillus prosopidis]|uniref:N-carbamoyl-L-amino-acid hydrolase n=1 Tax=Paenibacillus prosopidis TaxID=630520 RepID=A0A368VKK5_9BACL|nr:Zn-dependent hydrolase [Paenibacillus prosopidis]RCW42231.1 N-carbamoyl-L-amino-acid hydrolase [Paenibacillus prosopidis]